MRNALSVLIILVSTYSARAQLIFFDNVCENSTASFSLESLPSNTIAYQWQLSPDNTDWSDLNDDLLVNNSNSSVLEINELPLSYNLKYLRCKIDTNSIFH